MCPEFAVHTEQQDRVGAMMSEEQEHGAAAKRRTKSDVAMNTGLAIGFIVLLVVCQLALFPYVTRQKARVLASAQDGSGKTTVGAAVLASSAVQLVSCSDDDLADAVALVRPAVVNIDIASSDVGPGAKRGGPALDFDVPPSQALEANEETLGSGIVVDARGYILTCYHLVKDHPRTYVTVLSSARKTYRAERVGVDVANDLALLKISPDSPMPVATLANSDMVRTTETVLAIGSPFGFEHTVTGGIISDSKRSIAIGGQVYRDLFQTDACVNRGSAGGALVNTDGAVIGVNMAIASPSGHFAGISFAIPINKARALLLKAIEN